MKVPLNNSPDLSMAEITRKLFNSSFLSDITFCINGKVMHAHSLELMKRSSVFQKLLQSSRGLIRSIPISGCSYAAFYQFIRFIYTDMCELNRDIVFDVYKLAIKYKIPKLENRTMEYLNSSSYTVQLFELCLIERFRLPMGRIIENLAHDLSLYMKEDDFITIHPKALEQILSFKSINVAEPQLYHYLMKWLDNEMIKNPLPIHEARLKFTKYIDLIRFRAISWYDVLGGLSKTNAWLTKPDLNKYFKITVDGCSKDRHSSFCECRTEFVYPYEWIKFRDGTILPTQFSVRKSLLFVGLRYGNDAPETNHLIQLSSVDDKTNTKSSIVFKNSTVLNEKGSRIYSFGHSLQLEPNTKYTLKVTYLESLASSMILVRRPERDIIMRVPRNIVDVSVAGLNIFEMHFKPI